LLPQLGLDERRAHAMLFGRLHPGPMVAEVIHDGPVNNRRVPVLARDRAELREQLVLAEEAPVRVVARVLGAIELTGGHHDVGQADERSQPPGFGQFCRRVGLRVRGDEPGAVAKGSGGRPPEEGRIHTAREGDHDSIEAPEDLGQLLGLRRQGGIHLSTSRRTLGATRESRTAQSAAQARTERPAPSSARIATGGLRSPGAALVDRFSSCW
jgi:hypothetical protein